MGKKEEKPLTEVIMENLRGFGNFLYDPEQKTVLGRSGAGWARISIFYLFYYLFLACLFAISINITYSCLDKEEPYYQTRLETPGVTIQPKLLSKFSLSTDIRYTISDENSYKDYVEHLDTFLAPYSGQDFGPCSTGGGYGYAEGKPCIFVKVNKIIKWKAYGFTDLQVETDRATNRDENSKAPALVDALPGGTYDPSLMYIACYAWKEADQAHLGEVTYYPEAAPGLPLAKFPYLGKVNDPDYVPPIVAVQLGEVTPGEEISVGCKAYALNILDDARTNSGFIHFKVKIDS